ncbi:MAG: hypothetical protein A2Y06_07610 [Omnitrophica WOR_2 bacterium GWA2_37_7]|nr:MAG: hypothetical protein A2Y06_07610 [Omnitrophica WOR_2 bacterium GWA2_37_7]HAE36744.1 hypothetical protein [Candidatus Nomurabacteria bacterium]
MSHKASAIPIFDKYIPNILGEFLSLLGGENIAIKRLSKKHRLFPVIQFYLKNRDKDWSILEIPDNILLEVNTVGHFVVVLKNILRDAGHGKILMNFYKVNYIDTLCAEAQIASEYLRRRCLIRWPSIFCQDPPDLEIYDPQTKIDVDVEVKVKESKGSVESMFDSLSKGLQSLKRRINKEKPAIIVVHNKEDLVWEDWLNNDQVKKKLESRLNNKEYSIVSGIIFSGGDSLIQVEGGRQHCTRYLAYTSLVAKCKLPDGFLVGSDVA